jgi:hypothetical protein
MLVEPQVRSLVECYAGRPLPVYPGAFGSQRVI